MPRSALPRPARSAPLRPTPPNPEAAQALPRSLLVVLCACVALAQSMVAAVNLLIPRLAAGALHPTPDQLLWAVDAYVVVFAGLLIPAGALGDRYGRKHALLAGLAVFALGAGVSAAAPGMDWLIAGRALCGAGAALLMPATLSLVVQLTAPAERGRALAAWTLSIGLGGLAGNLAGGLAGQFLGWRVLFAVMPVLAAVLARLAAVRVPHTARNPKAVVDPVGSVLLTAAVLVLVDAIVEGPHRGWTSPRVLGAFAAAALLVAGFTVHAWRAARPLFDPRVFRSVRLRAAVLGTGLSFFGLFALFYVNAQFLQYAKGFSPALTGVAVAPVTLGMILVPRLVARFAPTCGPRPLAAGGLALIGAGLLLVSTCDAHTAYPLYAGWLLLLSIGMGLCAPTLTATVVGELPPAQAGLGAGLNTAAREVGAALGVAVVGSLLASRSTGVPGTAQEVARFTAGMDLGLRVVALTVLAGSLVVATGYRARTRPRPSAPGTP